MRLLPTGARMNGSAISVPKTVVRRSHCGIVTAPRGRNSTSSKTRLFSRSVTSASAPPSM
jgi:hypothetical protein